MNKKLEVLKAGLAILTTMLVLLPASAVLAAEQSAVPLFSVTGLAGTTLYANVTASAIYETRYSWIIEKVADPTEVYLRPGVEANVTYTVSVTKSEPEYSYYVDGYVCVENGGDRATENLTIAIDLKYHKGGGRDPWVYIDSYPVSTAGKPVLDPGESYCYPYRVDIPGGYWNYTKFKVDAKVTITNHSGRLGIPYGPSPDNTTERTNVTLHDCVTVRDTAGYEWSTCETASWTYVVAVSYDESKAGTTETKVNTATIVETGQEAAVTVTITYERQVKLRVLTGAFSKGYWSWSQYSKKTSSWQTRVSVEDVNHVNEKLGASFRTPKELADFLTSPVYGNMTSALMQQLIATLLNLKYGYVNGSLVVYYGGEFITIESIVENAKLALVEGTRTQQEYWKDLLDAINNNNVYVVDNN